MSELIKEEYIPYIWMVIMAIVVFINLLYPCRHERRLKELVADIEYKRAPEDTEDSPELNNGTK